MTKWAFRVGEIWWNICNLSPDWLRNLAGKQLNEPGKANRECVVVRVEHEEEISNASAVLLETFLWLKLADCLVTFLETDTLPILMVVQTAPVASYCRMSYISWWWSLFVHRISVCIFVHTYCARIGCLYGLNYCRHIIFRSTHWKCHYPHNGNFWHFPLIFSTRRMLRL